MNRILAIGKTNTDTSHTKLCRLVSLLLVAHFDGPAQFETANSVDVIFGTKQVNRQHPIYIDLGLYSCCQIANIC